MVHADPMRTTGTVREWHDDLGWGLLDSPDTPGGCWAHSSSLEPTALRGPVVGSDVTFDFEMGAPDEHHFRAVRVWLSTDSLEPVRVFHAADLVSADPTDGMSRKRAFELPLLWSGQVETAPGVMSGWHHHDRNESSLYVVRGILRLEFAGHDGYLDAGPGDFVHVPAYTIHRESNPTDEPSLAVIARVGGGVPTVNVDAPGAADTSAPA